MNNFVNIMVHIVEAAIYMLIMILLLLDCQDWLIPLWKINHLKFYLFAWLGNQGNLGPDCLESTILKITDKISVVIYSLLILHNSLLCQKIVDLLLVILTNDWLFDDITSCRWLKENNRLLFSVTGIDNQGLWCLAIHSIFHCL